MRNVLVVSDGEDMAGIGFAISDAINRHSEKFKSRQVRGADNYIKYPADLHNPTKGQVKELYQKADIIHLMEYPWALSKWIPEMLEKPAILHEHGTPYRNNPDHLKSAAKDLGMPILVSTVDLITDNEEWLPNPIDIDRMQEIRKERYVNDGVIRLAHAPTFRSVKHSDVYLAAAKAIGTDYLIIEKQTWEDTLREKARADILYDQLDFGYGLNGIEAGAMGMAVVGGFSDSHVRAKFLSLTQGASPLVEATPSTLGEVLERLVRSSRVRKSAAKRASAFVREFHDEKVIVKRLEEIYEKRLDG